MIDIDFQEYFLNKTRIYFKRQKNVTCTNTLNCIQIDQYHYVYIAYSYMYTMYPYKFIT